MLKLINYASTRNYKISKKWFWVVKEYKYLGCKFYCVKARKNHTYSRYMFEHLSIKYAYIEADSGHALLYNFYGEILSDKKFKKEVRKCLTKQSRYDGRCSLKLLIQNRKEDYKKNDRRRRRNRI